jgi:hypothetical protein
MSQENHLGPFGKKPFMGMVECRVNPDVAKSELHEPGQAGRKDFEANLLPNQHLQIIS